MTQRTANGPDPVDGLHLALLQRRADEVRKQLKFRTFGVKEGLLVAMLVCGISILASAEPGRSHTLHLVLGWALIVQAAGLYWSLRHAAAKELQRLTQRIAMVTDSPDGKIIEEAAGAARELLLGK
jgi:hypothetical protein